MDLQLKDKIAIITGGSIGIGLATAHELAHEGVHIVLAARHQEELDAAAKAIREKHGVQAIGVSVDVTKSDEIANLIRRTESEFGGIDILFNNAGTGSNETIMEASDDKWQYYWDLHVMAAVRLSRACVPSMRQRGGGVILNNASITAVQPLWYEPIYNVTKAALVMLSKNLAKELIPDNIRVNCINPGLILTLGWTDAAAKITEGTDTTVEQYLQQVVEDLEVPIKRFATAEELAYFIVFLCSPRASYSVGSTYYVDGGMLKVIT